MARWRVFFEVSFREMRHLRGGCLEVERRIENPRPSRFTVVRIADERPPARGEMDTDLMPAACQQPTAEQRHAGVRRGHVGQAFEPCEARRPLHRRHYNLLPLMRIAREPEIHGASSLDTSLGDGEVFPFAGG